MPRREMAKLKNCAVSRESLALAEHVSPHEDYTLLLNFVLEDPAAQI